PTALAAGSLTTACRCATALTAAQHLHGAANVNHNFGGVFFYASLIGPFASLQRALDVHLGTFTQIFARHFSQLAEQHNAVPLGLFFLLASRLVTPAFGGCQGNVGHCTTIRHVTDFRVLAQIPDQNYFVYASAGHENSPDD